MTMKELESCIEAYGKDIYNFCLHLTKEKLPFLAVFLYKQIHVSLIIIS